MQEDKAIEFRQRDHLDIKTFQAMKHSLPLTRRTISPIKRDRMTKQSAVLVVEVPAPLAQRTIFPVLAAISFCHLLNDMVQSLLPAIYPILKASFRLSFGQIGIITLMYQMTASLLQPFIGNYTDRKPT